MPLDHRRDGLGLPEVLHLSDEPGVRGGAVPDDLGPAVREERPVLALDQAPVGGLRPGVEHQGGLKGGGGGP